MSKPVLALISLALFLASADTTASRPSETEKQAANETARRIARQCQAEDDPRQCLSGLGAVCELQEGKKTEEYLCVQDFNVQFSNSPGRAVPDADKGNRYQITYRLYETSRGWRVSRKSVKWLRN